MTDMDEVRTILEGFDRSKLADLVSLMTEKGEVKLKRVINKSESPSKVIQYTSVTKHYTCVMCGYKFSATHKFTKGEQVTSVNQDGLAQTHTMNGKDLTLELHTHISHCLNCPSAIKEWDRERLEKTFVNLLNKITMKEAARLFE